MASRNCARCSSVSGLWGRKGPGPGTPGGDAAGGGGLTSCALLANEMQQLIAATSAAGHLILRNQIPIIISPFAFCDSTGFLRLLSCAANSQDLPTLSSIWPLLSCLAVFSHRRLRRE